MLSFETRTHASKGKRFTVVVYSSTERVNKQTKTSSVGVEKQEKKKISFPFKGFNFERMIIIIVMMMTKMPTTENKYCLSLVECINTFLIVRDFTHFQMKNRNRELKIKITLMILLRLCLGGL